MDNIIFILALIGFLGIGAQWVAWRLNLPAIVLMALAGLLFGPVLGVLNPEQDFGAFLRPIVAIAVAIILFEGGLSLKFAEIKDMTRGVARFVIPGVPIAWVLGALATHYVAGVEWPSAILFAGIMVVTGPTVIMPLLRQNRLNQRAGAILKWEGIVNDPIGALLAVITYEFVIVAYGGGHGWSTFEMVGNLFLSILMAGAFGALIGWVTSVAFSRGWVPEYLKSPVLLVLVIGCFEIPNLMLEEAGLLAVTVMGITMANTKLPSINQLRHFKENIAVLFVSGVFVILTANLDMATLAGFDWQVFAFVAVMLLLVRPISILVSTLGTDLSWGERIFTGWIAPRGIVAVAVTSFFATELVHRGVPGAEKLIPLAFAMVFATVVIHGFTMGPLAKLLGLASREKPGFLIVGASPWSVSLARKIHEMGWGVTVADDSWRALRPARQAGLKTYYGEILSEVTEHHLDLNQFGFLFAVGGNEAHNALVCTDLAPEMGRAAVFQISTRGRDETDRKALSYALQGRTLFAKGTGLDELIRRHYGGWTFQITRLTEAFGPEAYREEYANAEILLVERDGGINVSCAEKPVTLAVGDKILAYVPPLPDKKEQNDNKPSQSVS